MVKLFLFLICDLNLNQHGHDNWIVFNLVMKLFCIQIGANIINLKRFIECSTMATAQLCAFSIFSRIVFFIIINENSWIAFILLDVLMGMDIIFKTICKKLVFIVLVG